MVAAVDSLVSNAERAKLALEQGQRSSVKNIPGKTNCRFDFAEDWDAVADCTKIYWEQKKFFNPGSVPSAVADLLTYLFDDGLIYSGWLAGAGGGGFLYLICRETNNYLKLQKILSENEVKIFKTVFSWRSFVFVF